MNVDIGALVEHIHINESILTSSHRAKNRRGIIGLRRKLNFVVIALKAINNPSSAISIGNKHTEGSLQKLTISCISHALDALNLEVTEVLSLRADVELFLLGKFLTVGLVRSSNRLQIALKGGVFETRT